jgi:hypothetical protein
VTPKILRALLLALGLAARAAHAQAPARADSIPALDSARLLGDLSVLSADSMEGRRVGTSGGARARAFLLREFARIGLQPAVKGFTDEWSVRPPARGERIPFSISPRGSNPRNPPPMSPPPPPPIFGVNLVGVVRGTEQPDRYIVVSAHYDHVGVRDGEVYPGADDNASGTSAILAIAEWAIAHPPKNSILFAWFDGEEAGLLGSSRFVARPPVALDKVVAIVNADMVSRNTRGELYAAGAKRWPVMQAFLDSLAAVAPVALLEGHDGDPSQDDWTHRSDMGPFHDRGIPFVSFDVEEHIDYHKPGDTFEHIQPGFYYRSARTIAEFVRRLDAALDPVARARKGR